MMTTADMYYHCLLGDPLKLYSQSLVTPFIDETHEKGEAKSAIGGRK